MIFKLYIEFPPDLIQWAEYHPFTTHSYLYTYISILPYYTWWQSWLSKEVCSNCFDIISICNANPISLCSCGGCWVCYICVCACASCRTCAASLYFGAYRRLRCNLKRICLFSPIYLARGYLERAWMLQFPITRYVPYFLYPSDTFWCRYPIVPIEDDRHNSGRVRRGRV